MPVRVLNLFARICRFDVACIQHERNNHPGIVAADALSRSFPVSSFSDYDEDESNAICHTLDASLAPKTQVTSILNMKRYNLRSQKTDPSKDAVFYVEGLPYTYDMLKKAQENDSYITELIASKKALKHSNGLFYSEDFVNKPLLLLPDDIAFSVCSFLHTSMEHPGCKALASIFSRYFKTRNIQRLTNEICRQCTLCIKT